MSNEIAKIQDRKTSLIARIKEAEADLEIRTTERQASEIVLVIMAAYPQRGVEDDEANGIYCRLIQQLLMGYPLSVSRDLVDPHRGIFAQTLNFWRPSIPELKSKADKLWHDRFGDLLRDRQLIADISKREEEIEISPEERERCNAMWQKVKREILAAATQRSMDRLAELGIKPKQVDGEEAAKLREEALERLEQQEGPR